MRRRGTAWVAAVVAAALSGCGTVVNCTAVNGPAAREIYGGVKQDVQNGSGHLAEAFYGPCPSFSPYPTSPNSGPNLLGKSFCAGCGVCMLALDLPVSFVADTLTLPVTIPAALSKTKEPRKRKRSSAQARTAVTLPTTQSRTGG